MIALITGGSGCGKSTYAEKLVESLPSGDRYYIATMLVCDDECRARVKRHRSMRAGKGYITLERPKTFDIGVINPRSTVLLEDLPNLLANEMFSGGDPDAIPPFVRALGARCENLIVVTNDVFSDGARHDAETERYMRKLADINAGVARDADYACEMVYSLSVVLKGVEPCAL